MMYDMSKFKPDNYKYDRMVKELEREPQIPVDEGTYLMTLGMVSLLMFAMGVLAGYVIWGLL